jgi:ferric-dicitrate binding protein FerR (iron transport regulator)
MSDDPLARILADAGPRTSPPAGIEAGVREAVHQAWLQELSQRRRRERRRRWLAAAGVLIAAGAVLALGLKMRTPAADAGIFLASRGAVDITAKGRHAIATGGSALPAGTRIRTGTDGGALLAMGGASLRVGADSELSLTDRNRLELRRGRIFLDFGVQADGRQDLLLQTPLGRVEHLGTQYQARLEAGQMRVMVREGRVRITTADGEQLLGASEAADVDAAGRTHVHAAPASGPAWTWVSDLHPDFPIDGVTLADFLEWYGRETGRPVQYASAAVRAAAQATRLSGSIAGLSPPDALSAVIASTQFTLEKSADGDIRVGLRATAGSVPRVKLGADDGELLTPRTASSQ